MSPSSILIEPFYGGSHKQLIDLIATGIPAHTLFTLPAKKWPWRARTSALYFSQVIPESSDYRTLFCSSVLNLTELVALRPDLACLKKVIYFHENQLIYPVRKQQERDFQFGYNQITSCHAEENVDYLTNEAESVVNSELLSSDISLVDESMTLKANNKSGMNMYYEEKEDNSVMETTSTESQGLSSDYKKSTVCVCQTETLKEDSNHPDGVREPLHIVWPHRWEHDKDPESFFTVLFQLQSEGVQFTVSVIGESYQQIPEIFKSAAERLKSHISSWGYQKSKADYYSVLRKADVAVSTALHEFFGVAMIEAANMNCYTLCPNRLVYPEIFPSECLYNTQQQLYKRLRDFCRRPQLARLSNFKTRIKLDRFTWDTLSPKYLELFQTSVLRPPIEKDASRRADVEIVESRFVEQNYNSIL